MSFNDPGDYTAGKVWSAAQLNSDFYSNMTWLYAKYPQRATLFHDDSVVANGNPITGVVDDLQPFSTYFYQDAAVIDDQFTRKVRLGAGVYQVKFTGQQHSDGGIFEVDIGGASVGDGFDAYSAATVRDVDLLDTSFVELTKAGVYTVTVTVYDQNGGSGGFELRLTTIEFIPKDGDL